MTTSDALFDDRGMILPRRVWMVLGAVFQLCVGTLARHAVRADEPCAALILPAMHEGRSLWSVSEGRFAWVDACCLARRRTCRTCRRLRGSGSTLRSTSSTAILTTRFTGGDSVGPDLDRRALVDRELNWGTNLTLLGAVRLPGWVEQSAMYGTPNAERLCDGCLKHFSRSSKLAISVGVPPRCAGLRSDVSP